MRITNLMMNNNMRSNINRNLTQLDKLYSQMASGKKIQVPSDNPIIAGRSLKFRTNVSETEQFKDNVSQGISWSNATEDGFKTIYDIMEQIRTLTEQGANGVNSIDDKKKIMADISSLSNELSSEMNIDYAGRYVFSGYKTDEPVTFSSDQKDKKFNITEKLTRSDINLERSYFKKDDTSMPADKEVYRIKLTYDKIDDSTTTPTINFIDADGTLTSPTVNVLKSSDVTQDANGNDVTPYDVGDDEINFIEDTGELIIGKSVYDDIMRDKLNIEVNYDKNGFTKNDLNPVIYFDCIDKSDSVSNPDGISYKLGQQDIEYEFGVNNKISVNSLGKDIFTRNLHADIKSFTDLMNNVKISTDADLRKKFGAQGFMGEELDQKVADQIQDETKIVNNLLTEKFTTMIGRFDKHMEQQSAQHTDLGSRMNRLNMIDNRLSDDKLNFTKLLSDNEDIDYSETIMYLNSAQNLYQASLQTGMSITKLSLVNYL